MFTLSAQLRAVAVIPLYWASRLWSPPEQLAEEELDLKGLWINYRSMCSFRQKPRRIACPTSISRWPRAHVASFILPMSRKDVALLSASLTMSAAPLNMLNFRPSASLAEQRLLPALRLSCSMKYRYARLDRAEPLRMPYLWPSWRPTCSASSADRTRLVVSVGFTD